MSTLNTLERGREAFRQRDWSDAYRRLTKADQERSLDPENVEKLAIAAYLIGKEDECSEFWARAHSGFKSKGDTEHACRCAFWLGFTLMMQGEGARGSGWISRAGRLLEENELECVIQGFLLLPQALQCLRTGDTQGAHNLFTQAGEIGRRFNNPDMITLSRLGRGQALIQQKEISNGTTLLDEAMVSVTSEEVSPIVAGIVYCAVIEACQKIYDIRRAQEWTAALSRWCDSKPYLVPFRGQCLVRRAEIMQLRGEWPEAMNEVEQVCRRFQTSSPPATGEAFYRQAELYRLRGESSKAEDSYREANKWGRKPQPGLVLLRLAQGQIDVAEAAIRRVEEEKKDRVARSRILPAYIEIMLAADDVRSAETAADELFGIAAELDAPFLEAIAARAQGSVLLAKDKPRAALDKLYNAWSLLKKMEASYESEKTRVLIGLACRELGDMDTARMELDTARQAFLQLGATPDVARMDFLLRDDSSEATHGLTPRQLEVLRLLAKGKSNKTIADELFISERTVERHVSDILAKLDVPSRVAATAYAYEHQLV